ncbi:hypothetical protein [Allostreptomyces psammosilenae]|uniref:Guanylate cyclase domain-containing protein n=1 Tax=Allostreptomyces psammosilenae TaxID=1892865 RepID=A0A853AAZ7_9ACTN|nr:hypothetical protein [Allostreptomyces psammosilenae]NYI07791.1 hypothetical protein [Allostreptomyces psammosilenae]
MDADTVLDDRDVPDYRALFVIDMKDYSKARSVEMPSLREDFDALLAAAFARSGLAREWSDPEYYSDTGDGVILGLPIRRMARLVDPFVENLNRLLERYEKQRLASAPPIRARVSVHVGPLPEVYRGAPINEVCRFVNSDAARRGVVRAAEYGSFTALLLSDEAHRVVVRDGRTERLTEKHFLRVEAEVPDKGFSEVAWLHVPGVTPSVLAEPDAPPPSDASSGPAGSPPRPPSTPRAGAAPKYQIGSVGNVVEHMEGSQTSYQRFGAE